MKFRVTDRETGKEPDLQKIALKEAWAHELIYCDMDGFAVTQFGMLILMDECGSFRYCPEGRFEVVVG